MHRIKYVSAPCGSGKTHAVINNIVEGRYEENLLLVQPTTELIDNTNNEITRRRPSIHIEIFHSVITKGTSVASQLIERFRNPYDGNHVFITTHATFFSLPYVANKAKYDVVIDEAPVLLEHFNESLPVNHSIITKHLIVEPKGSSYGILKPNDVLELRSIAENRNKDSINQVFSKLAKLVLSADYISYVRLDQYQKLISGKDNRRLEVYSVLQPTIFSGYRSVTILGARFEETALFKYWSGKGVHFENDTDLESQLRYTDHNNGNLVRLHYGTEDNWSKHAREKKYPELRKKMIDASKLIFGERASVWSDNNDMKKKGDLADNNNIELPGKSHGLNSYQDIDNALIIPALNNKPDVQRFLREVLDISDTDQKIEMTGHTIYQALSRTSIRDPSNINMKDWIVADRVTAEYIASIYPGSTINSLGLLMPSACVRRGRPSVHKDSNQRKQVSREKKMRMIANLDEEEIFVREDDIQAVYWRREKCDVSPIRTNSYFVANFKGSIFNTMYDRKYGALAVFTDEKFIRELRECSRIRYETKDQNLLISPAYFDPYKVVEAYKSKENIVFIKGIWMDVDGGDMKPKDFAGMFPHLRIVCYNTFSSTSSNLRYRIYIPTDKAMTNEVYTLIIREIIYVVESSGFASKSKTAPKANRRFHGIDHKRNGCDLFYLPCQPQDPTGAFFMDFKKDRKPLKVKDWIFHGVSEDDAAYQPAPPPLSVSDELTPEQELKVADALREWDAVGSKRGNGNEGIFKLGLRLRHVGLSAWGLETALMQAAANANSPSDRKADVRRFIQRVRRGSFG
ncbi:hypothetical protein DA075_06015 [Methylobacterium currus]|uniref:Helicase ATP-binding domain-containing protein n=1 Tax=Methylobacterium currus TaxID=2051553 RepID=A0A2R4WT46_9HYPH|nr:DEAD/DEAH box helicase [Methylobacterium currus]AWB24715.1 hypothetical protein DA075_06015 [Methylobacterium currus]